MDKLIFLFPLSLSTEIDFGESDWVGEDERPIPFRETFLKSLSKSVRAAWPSNETFRNDDSGR